MARTAKPRAKPKGKSGQLRIIGGEWRGRKLNFPDIEGLRPTADRVRETLFNWLQMELAGAYCLDLFAGSGALGLEALSRGAAKVVMVERDINAARQIREHLQTLKAKHGYVENGDALQFLTQSATRFDIVFLDPPYALGHLQTCYRLLETGSWLKDGSLVCIEDSSNNPAPQLPSNWQLIRSKKAGNVAYYLAKTGLSS